NNNFDTAGTINSFCDLTVISGSYFASVFPPNISGAYQSAVSIYSGSGALQGTKAIPAGFPMKVFSKGNYVKIYTVMEGGHLIAQKYTIDEIINSASGRIITNRKIYKMEKL
ncbi:MAG TPA: hypothetical protein VHP30_11630, partial [Ignavibacteriales bacterium]|nr:hypothetical protein [Ignavibacteriales bacterium]